MLLEVADVRRQNGYLEAKLGETFLGREGDHRFVFVDELLDVAGALSPWEKWSP